MTLSPPSTSPRRLALIGQRGVGKTSLLSRIDKIYRAQGRRIRTFDLDREIEQNAGRSISAIFQEDGEAVFRRHEINTLDKLEKEISRIADDVVIALGAGFPVSALRREWHAIWVRRPSDESGRIFTDRPRLDARVPALEEFHARATERSSRFNERADDVLFLDEGSDDVADPAESDFFLERIRGLGAALTVQTENFARDFATWAARRRAWGLRWFELRDDLLSIEQMELAWKLLPQENILLSLRAPDREEHSLRLIESSEAAFDWPMERRRQSPRTPRYVSLHTRAESIEASLDRLVEFGRNVASAPGICGLKAALPIANFNELLIGHRWQLEDPSNRIFLPMSDDGRWSWYRLLRGTDFSLNFIRESSGSASDQPTLLQWVRRQHIHASASSDTQNKFAAVLGDPVAHSRTPMEQADLFRKRGLGVSAVRVTEQEWRDGAIAHLVSLGLSDAAVTAPLKRLAFELADPTLMDEAARELESVNTLHFSANKVRATNTDLEGLRRAAAQYAKDLSPLKTTVVWGGGGTLDVVRRVFPQAQLVSVRTGLMRETNLPATPPDLVIWAANLKPSEAMRTPPSTWRPKVIFDLNYSEASAARDYAVKIGARYISGLAMFKAQAQAQREFWEAL